MARRSSPVTQADIARLIRGAIAAGVGKEHIVGIRQDRDGVTVLFGERKATAKLAEMIDDQGATDGATERNDWDDAA